MAPEGGRTGQPRATLWDEPSTPNQDLLALRAPHDGHSDQPAMAGKRYAVNSIMRVRGRSSSIMTRLECSDAEGAGPTFATRSGMGRCRAEVLRRDARASRP